MKIAWFTEGGWSGKVPRNFEGMRNDSAWMCVLDAIHFPINQIPTNEKFDLGIVTIPKKNIDVLSKYPLIENLRKCCDKIAYMQEGPHWYFQDYPLDQQIWFYNILMEMDFLYVHNKSDKKYYKGLVNKECRLMPTLMIEDLIKNLPQVERNNIMIGGNFCSWYGGFDSYIVAQELECKTYVPTMGRKIEGEEQMPNLNHLPYMNWAAWIKTLNQFKYGIHLMRTHAAGTFALNCAYLGIPCIGYSGLDTQEICHPDLTVNLGDLENAKRLLTLLEKDKEFYNKCSQIAKTNYKKYFHEDIFNSTLKK
jgi:hypothetical protein|tara:strand:- start:455 stop:1378 length:924 start_codon:yes stop_codon:yes gene_type:complete